MGFQIRETPNDGETVSRIPVRAAEHESAIIAAAKDGQIGSFELLIQRYEQKILLRALRITRNWQDAEDVKQQSILKAFAQLHSFQGKSSFSTWLVRIAINEALMLLRKKHTCKEVPMENACEPDGEINPQDLPHSPLPDEPYFAQERKRILYAALNQLTPAIRMAIQLREMEERSTRETARILGISIAATKSRVFHGRRRLRELLNCDPRMRGFWGRPVRRIRDSKRPKVTSRGNIKSRLRHQAVPPFHNLCPFPAGVPQTPRILLEGG